MSYYDEDEVFTCWENPERCSGCNYCAAARDTGEGIYPLSSQEAHDRDMGLSRPAPTIKPEPANGKYLEFTGCKVLHYSVKPVKTRPRIFRK